ncbi:hypothetical protein YC2023_072460 [Brassica napus]
MRFHVWDTCRHHSALICDLESDPVGLGKIAKHINAGQIDSHELIKMKTLKTVAKQYSARQRIPPPPETAEKPFRALIFDRYLLALGTKLREEMIRDGPEHNQSETLA